MGWVRRLLRADDFESDERQGRVARAQISREPYGRGRARTELVQDFVASAVGERVADGDWVEAAGAVSSMSSRLDDSKRIEGKRRDAGVFSTECTKGEGKNRDRGGCA